MPPVQQGQSWTFTLVSCMCFFSSLSTQSRCTLLFFPVWPGVSGAGLHANTLDLYSSPHQPRGHFSSSSCFVLCNTTILIIWIVSLYLSGFPAVCIKMLSIWQRKQGFFFFTIVVFLIAGYSSPKTVPSQYFTHISGHTSVCCVCV